MTDREPVDTREQPECLCPVEGPAHPECPMHAWRSESLYPVRTPRDARGVTRTGYQWDEDVEEDVKF